MHMTRPSSGVITHRRPSRAVRLGAVLVAAVVLFGVGAAIGRVTGDPGGSPAPADGPTAADRTVQVHPGPSEVIDGVPVGYPHSRDGAIAAAANYAVILDSPVVLDSARAGPALNQMATSDAKDELGDRFELAAGLLRERLNLDTNRLETSGVVMRTVPLGYRVLDYRRNAATVAVWGTSVFVAAGSQAVGPGWGTTEVTLRWEGGDWRVSALANSDGPIPPAAGSDAAAMVAAQIQRFTPLWQIPPAEE